MKKKLPKINKIAEGRKKGKKVLYKIFSGVLDFEILIFIAIVLYLLTFLLVRVSAC